MDHAAFSPALPAEPVWLPLGTAQVIDWKYLGRAPSARGATAWLGRVGREPVLIRASTQETATTLEFLFLAHEELTGVLQVVTSRPVANRLRVEVRADVEGKVQHAETHELVEHSRTGLYGPTVRTMDGDLAALGLPEIGSLEAEVFEFAPESALSTTCGRWAQRALETVRAFVLDGVGEPAVEPALEQPSEPPVAAPPSRDVRRAREVEPDSEPPAPRYEPPRPEPRAERPEPRAERPEPRPAPMAPPDRARPDPRSAAPAAPTPSPPAKKRAPRLVVATNAGESWEVTDPETYIGRSKQCAIVLKSQRVSRKHASITQEGDGFYLNDLGAANGIWAGTEKIERERLEHGSEYIVGDVLLSFSLV
jgi:hypothetical protein